MIDGSALAKRTLLVTWTVTVTVVEGNDDSDNNDDEDAVVVVALLKEPISSLSFCLFHPILLFFCVCGGFSLGSGSEAFAYYNE